MDLTVGPWSKGITPGDLDEVAALWNDNAVGRHGFFPWTGALLRKLVTDGEEMYGRLIEARDGGKLVGFAHACVMTEDGYPPAGSVEVLLTAKSHRRRGIGTRLLDACLKWFATTEDDPKIVNALGAWPFGWAYDVLCDGSERSGVFMDDGEMYRLFRRAGFDPVRKSLVMRADVGKAKGATPRGMQYYIAQRRDDTWLDRVFRGRELWDHVLCDLDWQILSRAIFGLMPEVSRWEGKTVFSVFGVNTPERHRDKGYAAINIGHMMEHIRGLGCDELELHVYADNEPALALYRRLGFRQLAETMMMHKRL